MTVFAKLWRSAFVGAALIAGVSGLAPDARAETARAKAILVLDASGSMWGQIDGKAKWDIAKVAVDKLVTGWDPAIDLGLTVYSHRTKGACDDIEDVIPVGPVNAAEFKAVIDRITPKGKTPMTAAVKRAAEQLKYTEDAATVILISDGEETCNLDPCSIATELEQRGVTFTAHVVGFDIRDQKTRDQLKCIADNTGGTFVQADDAASLQAALATVAAATAEAPAPVPPPAPAPPAATKGRATFKAIYGEGQPVTDDELKWEIFPDVPGQEELGASVAFAFKAEWTPGDPIPPGDYIVRASVGAASVQQPARITGEKQEILVNLGAAVITASASETDGGPRLARDLGWKVLNGAGDTLLFSYDEAPSFTVPAGDYTVTVDYKDARGQAAVSVQAGDKPALAIVLGSGSVEASVRRSETEPLATDGVTWKIYAEGSTDAMSYSYDARPVFRLAAGKYRITAEIGEGMGEANIEVKAGETRKLDMVLGVGFLKPTAIFAPGAPKPTKGLTWRIYKAEVNLAGERGDPVITNYDLEPQFTLPAGKYYVEVRADEATAGVEFEVKAGAVAAPVVNLNAGAILGSAAVSDIKSTDGLSWQLSTIVVAMTGKEKNHIATSYDAEPVWIVPAGTYIVEVKAGDRTAEVEVTVEAGKPSQVSLTLP